MDYIELNIQLDNPVYAEILEAELAELPFDSFQIEASKLKAYIPADHFRNEEVDVILKPYQAYIEDISIVEIAHQNWNQLWESSYDPAYIGNDIVIKAPFHTHTEARKHIIIIDPNMSFGTGHHPTTHMILEAMENIPIENKDICDFGCGSGILSIYAAARGARGFGIEIDAKAAESARQNLFLNKTQGFNILTGDLSTLEKSQITFDVLLANINRNVIEESVHVFHEKARSGAYLFCAGFLDEDAEQLSQHLEQAGFPIIDQQTRDGWTMLLTRRTP